jgi:serine/threonine-protein kinase
VINGVPAAFDELVERATARDPADRYADAQDMAAELGAIVDELRLPDFRVPSPRDSALHRSAAMRRSATEQHRTTEQLQSPPGRAPVHHPTRQLTREPSDWPAKPVALDADEYHEISGQFAGIEMIEFALERQRARRMVLIWIAIVLSITGMVAAAAWTVGSNVSGLL